MSDFLTGTTFGGSVWTPNYVKELNQRTCIACGRCFKVCPRDVFDLVDKDDIDTEDFDDDYKERDNQFTGTIKQVTVALQATKANVQSVDEEAKKNAAFKKAMYD